MPAYQLMELPERELLPGYFGRFVHTDRMTLVSWNIRAGSPLPEHSHPHEQIATLLEGEYEMTVDGQVHQMRAGSVVVIPGGVRHSGLAKSECRIIDVFQPPRDEYR